MTPQEKCDLIKTNSGDLFPRMHQKANELLIQGGDFDQRINQAYQIVDALAHEVGKVAICKQGCNHCCYQSVLIPLWEARRIAKFIGRKQNHIIGYGHDGDTQDKLRDRHAGTPCPFLEAGGCAIYPVRPFVCRLHFSMDEDVSLCDIVAKPHSEVPYFDFEKTKMFMTWMFVRKSRIFGDIREFFEERN